MRHICLECGKQLPEKPLFVLDNAPASAQDIPDENELEKDTGITLNLYRCPECGLVQFNADPVPYYRDVIRAGGLSSTMTDLRREQFEHLISTYHLEGKKFIEVGCGSGEFLQILEKFPVHAYGIEHKPGLVKKAQGNDLSVWEFFPETKDARFPGAPYDVFLSFNFLEHLPDPSTMLQAIYNNLNADGIGLITVPALEYIAARGIYYELIHDHLAYYSSKSLRRLMELNGFEVLEEKIINRDTLSVTVRKMPDFIFSDEVSFISGKATDDSADASLAASLVEGYGKVTDEIEALIVLLRSSGKRLALWGAGHQGFTLASTTALGTFASYIIDSATFKQGRYAPASHLKIVPPIYYNQDPTDAILIVAPGYTDEIAQLIRSHIGGNVSIFALRSDMIEDLS